MAWEYSAPSNGQGITAAVMAAIETDLQTFGGDVDAASWGLTNTAFVVLNPGELPGNTSHTVTGASYNTGAGVVTLTFSATHNIAVGQLVIITGISPSGYNAGGAAVPVTAVPTSSEISFYLGTNPGTYSSGGSVAVGPIVPVAGMLAADPNGNLWMYSGSAWVQQTVTAINLATQVTGTLGIAHGGTGTGSTLTGLLRGSGSAMTAAELSGDATTSGSNAVTVGKVNGSTLPTSAPLIGTNGSGQLVLASPFTTNPQTSTYQVTAADFSSYKTIVVASGTFTITLVASSSQPAAGQLITVINYGTGTVTIARSGQNINGGTSSITLAAATATAPVSAEIVSDGTNYFASLSGGSSGNATSVNGAAVPNSAALLGSNSSGQLELSAAFGTNPQTGTYTAVAADFSNYKTILVASGTFTVTLVASGSQPAAGQFITIINYGSGVVTVAPNGQDLNGGTSSLTIPSSSASAPSSATVLSDGTNYFAQLCTQANVGSGVGGAGNLTTTGCVPYVSASGVLNEDTTVGPYVNSSTHRVGVSTSTPECALDVNGTIRAISQTVPASGAGLELLYSGSTAYVQAYSRTASTYEAVQVTGSTVTLTAASGASVNGLEVNSSGVATQYSGNALAGAGLASVVGAVNLTGQNGNISATTIVNTPQAGMYRVYLTIAPTVSGSSGTLPSVTITWTSQDTSSSMSDTISNSVSSPSETTLYYSTALISAASGVAIKYSTSGFAAGSPSLTYAIHINIVLIG
jgi:hypothetical protein